MKDRKFSSRKSFYIPLGIVLSLILIWCKLSTPVLADEMGASTEITVTYVNPIYGDETRATAQDKIASLTADETNTTGEYYSDVESAAAQMRKMLKERVETFDINYYYYCSSDSTAYQTIASEISEEALVHTGVPTEGDYLRFQVDNWYCSASGSYEEEEGRWDLTLTYTVIYFTTLQQEEEVTTQVASIISSLDLENASTYEKIQKIYAYICQNVTYDYDNLDNDDDTLKYSAYAALTRKKAVCQGYSNLLYRLLLEAGIDNRIVSGTGNGGAHSWNIVKLGDYYYNLDATWDASVYAASNSFLYFLKSNENFTDHIRNEVYTTNDFNKAYPMASEDYVSSDNQVDEISHNYQSIVTEPTCELAGYTTFICTRCGDSYVGNETAALGHNYQSIVTEPTCTKDGNETYTCTTCGDSYVLYETAAIGHCYDLEVIEPTCLEAGYETYTCTTCGDRYVRGETAALGHDYQTIVTEPTCELAGYTTFICTRCGDSYVGDETAALGHDYEITIIESTCSTAGYTNYNCKRCNEGYNESSVGLWDEVSQIPHTVVTDAAVPATCTTTGLTEGTHCSVCGTVLTTQEIVEKLAHNYTETVVAPTTTSTGYTIYTCSSCGDSYKGNITAKLTTATVTLAKPTVTLSNTSSGVKITWSKVNGAKGYIVYRRVAGGKFATLTKITNSGTTTFTDKTAKAGTTYYYTVKAYSGSTYSSYVTNKLIKYLKQPTVNLLNASKGVKVTWTKTAGASGYYIYRKTANGSFTKIKTITSGSTVSFTDTTAKAGTTYYYTVKAYAKSGAKTYTSSYVTNKTIKRLTQPTVTLSKVTKGVKIAWKKITGASGYYVYRKTVSGSWNKIKTISSASTTSFVDTTAKKGTTYYYTVKAYNGSSFSSYITNKKIKID
jgi:hypothetical protein